MGWFKRAVEVKTVTERVEVPVVGAAMVTPLYVVEHDSGETKTETVSYAYGSFEREVPVLAYKYYATCEQAHASHPGLNVTQANTIRIGRQYFLVNSLSDIKVEPKPKVAKGKGRS